MLFINTNGSYIPPPNTWKGSATKATIPAYSRPFINSETDIVLGPQPTKGQGGVRGPNPIKHWRKQLNPRKVDGISTASYSIQSDMPGANVHLGVNECCSNNNPNNSISEYIPDQNLDSHDSQATLQQYLDDNTDYCGPPSRKICCNPQANRIRSAMATVPINPVHITDPNDESKHIKINKSYSFSTKEYLRSKNKTYEQNLSGAKLDESEAVYSVDSGNSDCCAIEPLPYGATQNTELSTNKNMNRNYLNGECCVHRTRAPMIVKPNNQQYFQQGAVDSSSRIARLKYNTVNKNAESFRDQFGNEAVSAAQYTASGNSPFFIKSITQTPLCPKPAYRPQAITIC
tara:strand:+ start:2201 stop:3235 length:1035 start_codon:yes stop_codon:yes gene_type:complete